jgi:hypothetical protein
VLVKHWVNQMSAGKMVLTKGRGNFLLVLCLLVRNHLADRHLVDSHFIKSGKVQIIKLYSCAKQYIVLEKHWVNKLFFLAKWLLTKGRGTF